MSDFILFIWIFFLKVILEDRLLGEFNDFLLVDQQYLKGYVLEYAFRHNYTMNREAIAEAIEDRYTYWPDASDENAIRKEFIHVCWLFLRYYYYLIMGTFRGILGGVPVI